MKIFGYARQEINEDGLYEMAEITFQADPGTLKAVAAFLSEAAEVMEKNPGGFDHSHLQDSWRGWQDGYPDVIVADST